ncbi:MAG: glycosyltransferase family 39 protein [Candidatus Sericytochromatia bacterium]|nr:glycosyltransferase family 39 protein [Candidatus Tanganyikabacteria bacterium]
MRRYLPYLGLAGLLAIFWVWTHDYMLPGYTGLFNDDATYFTSARAMAEGRGYVVGWATPPYPADRYPIGYPAWLALFWTFPLALLETRVRMAQEANILLATLFLLVSFLFAYRKLGLPAWACLAGIGLAALSPFCLYYTPTLMSDLPAALCLVAGLWLVVRYVEKPGFWRVAAAGAVTALAVLVRYQAGVLLIVGVAYLLWQRRFKAAAAYGGLTLALLAPWIWWVASNHAFGYASQIGHVTFGTWTMRALTLLFSSAYMFLQGIPSFLWQRQFLTRFPFRTNIALDDPVFILVGLAISGLILAGIVLAMRRKELRLPGALVLGTLALVLVWQTGFLNLGEHLTVRLILSVAPLMLVFAFVGWADGLAQAHRPFRILAATALGLAVVINGAAAFTLWQKMKVRTVPDMIGDRYRLQALVSEFARQVPEDVLAGSNFEPLFHLITGRPCTGAPNSPKLLAAQILTEPRLRFLVMVPSPVGTRDLTIEAIRAINRRFPRLIYTIEGSDGQPTGVFRIERSAIDKAPVLEDDEDLPAKQEPPRE